MKKTALLGGLCLLVLSILFAAKTDGSDELKFKTKLSDYGFFEGKISDMNPIEGVVPYSLNTPLFSDYAEKMRFVKLPHDEKVSYNDSTVLDFPIGTILIKTFYYFNDVRDDSKGRQLIETRLLLHEPTGWEALVYVWNEEQTEAYLDVAGGEKYVTWKNEKGKKQKVNYLIPNLNQCKGCHNKSQKMTPIGPSIRQLNGDFTYQDEVKNQLLQWQDFGMLEGLPPNLENIPKTPIWNDMKSGDVNSRARAYLDINCAHCHSQNGPARTSGLYLDHHEQNPNTLGINKSPVAAGRGSGDREFTIVAGKPDESIMVFRMESEDAGIRMPEISRQLVHKEGVALIREWIEGMK